MGDDKEIKDRGKQIVNLYNKLTSMSEYKLLLRIRSLDSSLYVFEKNYQDLRTLLTLHSDVKEAIRLRKAGKKPEMRGFLYEITRLLQNFVASVKSLIDHTRIIYREIYKGGEEFPNYQAEVDRRFTKNPLAQFVEDLRDYCLHYESPPLYSLLHYSQTPPVFESGVKLNTGVLKKYSNWSPAAKQYIADQGDSIDLLKVVDEYHASVTDFYRWVKSRQKEIHSQAFSNVAAIQKELENLITEEDLNTQKQQ